MTTTKITARTTVLALLAVGLLAGTASASDWGFGIRIGDARIGLNTAREWVPAHYETRSEQVLVSPAHYERQLVPARYETRLDRYGRSITVCVQNAGWTNVYVPDQYETRMTQVLVPGYYTDACSPIYAPTYSPRVVVENRGFAPRASLTIRHDDDRRYDNARRDNAPHANNDRRNDNNPRNGRR